MHLSSTQKGSRTRSWPSRGPGIQEPTGTLCRSPLYTVTVVRTREVFQTAWSEEQEALLGLTVPQTSPGRVGPRPELEAPGPLQVRSPGSEGSTSRPHCTPSLSMLFDRFPATPEAAAAKGRDLGLPTGTLEGRWAGAGSRAADRCPGWLSESPDELLTSWPPLFCPGCGEPEITAGSARRRGANKPQSAKSRAARAE